MAEYLRFDIPSPGILVQLQIMRHGAAYRSVVKMIDSGGVVLDLGCGSGFGTQFLARELPDSLVLGVDKSKKRIKNAARKYGADNCSFVEGNVVQLPFPSNSANNILSFQMIEHLTDPAAFLREAHRVLRPSGRLYITTPNRILRLADGEKPWNIYHVHEYKPRELGELIATVFDSTELHGVFAVDQVAEIEQRRIDKRGKLMSMANQIQRYLPAFVMEIATRIVRNRRAVAESIPFVQPSDFFVSQDNTNKCLDILCIGTKK